MSNLTYDFTGRTAIVTGAARGIGFEIGKFFHHAGADVMLVDADAQTLKESAEVLGCLGTVADVTDSESVENAVNLTIEQTGRIDILVNNAGILRDRLLWKMSDDEYEQVMAVHAGGTFRFTRACVPHFRAQNHGRVINVTSYTGLRGNPGQANYAMAKAGIIGFTKTAAKELASFGVTVNAISPNAETQMVASIPEAKKAQIASQIPLGRFADPSEMAAAVGFLASAEAGYITGAVLPVDGGIAI
jgi:3-oxoacyl-[acyl-carrier protein] reductase